ncbi:Quinoprotein alcohol dehydrogenase-like [Trema orientale]|uniref:Quinoprotein alcohol dehydrogenase-like n=1 Tax=Trema orientale TaxID=63057 RepID=A0A2P5FXS4_TREOI|nr:Quinoprotein alcohol dehydrogenase-like [Trema orientale]
MFSHYGSGKISTLRLPGSLESGDTSLVVAGSDNGVVCLSEYSTKTTIYLWNPTTGEVKKLPPPTYCRLWQNFNSRLGLIYDPVMNDFKVVMVCSHLSGDRVRDGSIFAMFQRCNTVVIYSLRTNSWKRIQMSNIFSSSSSVSTLLNYDCSVVVNGSIHWTLYYHDQDNYGGGRNFKFGVVAFSLTTEEFKLIKAPQHIKAKSVQSIGKLSENLSFINRDAPGSVEIWIMKEHGASYSWIKQASVDLTFFLKWPSLRKWRFFFRHEWLFFQQPHEQHEQVFSIAFGNNVYVIICSASHGLFWYNLNSNTLEYLGPEITVVGFNSASTYLLN